jgi:hypothetical protein
MATSLNDIASLPNIDGQTQLILRRRPSGQGACKSR